MELPCSRDHCRYRLALYFLVFLCAAGSTLKAELTWEQKTVDVNGDAHSPVIEARFRFTNTGQSRVEIRNVESSCGCTTTALEKRVYDPRASGEIIARYTPGTHTGLQKKTILVVTNDGREPVTLTLMAHIPEILRITPPTVTWPHKAASSPKQILLEVMQVTPVDEISVESSNPEAVAALTTVAKGRKYEVTVTPKQTDHFLYAKLMIHCRFGDQEKTFVAFATVQPASGT